MRSNTVGHFGEFANFSKERTAPPVAVAVDKPHRPLSIVLKLIRYKLA